MESLPTMEMTAAKKKPERKSGKTERSQEQLREVLQKRFDTLLTQSQEDLNKYDVMCIDGSFDDEDDEESGSGDKRKQDMQSRIVKSVERAENMKSTLDSNAQLPQSVPQIEVSYVYADPKTNKSETKEITLDIEKKLQEFIEFYKEKGLDLPATFEADILDIWEKNGVEIQEAIEKDGFDDILIMPPNIPLPVMADKMKMGNGYYESSNFTSGGSFTGAVSQNVDKPRIVLVHRTQNLTDRPELGKTLNIKGNDVDQDHILTIEDYLIFQNIYFKQTTKHLDEVGYTWLATKSGARLVYSGWGPDSDGLYVGAHVLEDHGEGLGARPSRSFY